MKEYLKNLLDTKNNLLGPTFVFGACFLVFGLLIQSAVTAVANKDQSITVTGSTERIVKSDTAKWTISVSERAYGEGASNIASRNAQKSSEIVKNYLTKNGVDANLVSIGTAYLSPICELSTQGYENCSLGVKGQTATQNIVIESKEVDQISNLSGKLLNEIYGANIASNNVEYFFNGLKDVRVEMLSEATKNAKERAEAVANAGGAKVGNITSLSSGVFQVTQKNSVNIDDYGAYDTSSIDKKITATVKVNFSVR